MQKGRGVESSFTPKKGGRTSLAMLKGGGGGHVKVVM